MHGKVLCGVIALFALGCSDPQPVSMQRGIAPGADIPASGPLKPPEPPPPPPPPTTKPSSLSSPFSNMDPGALQRPVVVDAGIPSAPTAAPEQDAGKPRDLSSELVEKLGRPADCVDLQKAAAAGGRLNIVVVAEVMPSGRITRAQASAPDQPASALRCLENKATSAGLRGPVPGAPLSVTATIPIDVVYQPTQR